MAIVIETTQINAKFLGGLALNKIMLGVIEIFPNIGSVPPAFDPSEFFTGLDDGLFYNFNDIESLFRTHTGLNVLTSGGQPIAAVANQAFQGDWFDITISGFTVSEGDGVVTRNGNQITITGATITTVVMFQSDVQTVPGLCRTTMQTTGSGTGVTGWIRGAPSTVPVGAPVSWGAPLNNSTYDAVQISSGTVTFDIDYQMWRGIPTLQQTAAARPLADSRYNLGEATEDFTNAVYRRNNMTATPQSGIAPDGTNTSNFIQLAGTGAASMDQFSTNHGRDLNVNQTHSIFFKPGTLTTIKVGFLHDGSTLTIATGAIANAPDTTSGLEDLGNGWFRFWSTGIRRNEFVWHAVVLDELIPTSTATCELWGWSLENPTSVPAPQPYQRVTTPTDYNWQIAALGARFDVVDDVMTSAQFSLAGDVRTMCLAVEWIAPQSGVAAFANHGYTAFGPGMGITGANQNAYNIEGTSGGNRATSPPNYPVTNRASVIAINEPMSPYIEIQVNGNKTANNGVQGGPFAQAVPFSIGRGQGFNDPANCRVIAVLLINRALTLTEQQQWNDWTYDLLGITP